MISPPVFVTHEVIAHGPLRAEFVLAFKTALADRVVLEGRRKIAIDLGARLARFDVEIDAPASPPGMAVALGLTTHDGRARVRLAPEAGFISAREAIDDAFLGTGVVTRPAAVIKAEEIKAATRDEAHAHLHARRQPGKRLRYFAGHAWSEAREITSHDAWTRYLEDVSENIQEPIRVNVTQ